MRHFAAEFRVRPRKPPKNPHLPKSNGQHPKNPGTRNAGSWLL